MAIYSLKEVEKLTGIKAHTLRIWERRYSFLAPDRTNTNIRFYSDAELKSLLNIAVLLRNGFRISQIDRMNEEEIDANLNRILSSGEAQDDDLIYALNICMLSYDEKGFIEIFDRQMMRIGLSATILNLIYPFLKNVGILWARSKTTPAQEHFVSNIIRQKVIASIDRIAFKHNPERKILMYIPEGEQHELGLLLGNYLARDLGWEIVYLGLNVPFNNLIETIEKCNPKVIFTIITMNNHALLKEHVLQLKPMAELFLYSGLRNDIIRPLEDDKFLYLENPEEFLAKLKSF